MDLGSSNHKKIDVEDWVGSVFDHAPAGVVLVNREASVCKANRYFCDLLGYELEELISTDFRIISHLDDEKFNGIFQAKPDGFQTQNYYTHKNGNEVFVEISLSPVKGKNNQAEYAIAHILDISRQKSIDEKLQISEKRLQEAQYISHLGFWELDLDKDELYWSDELYRLYGLDPQESLLHFREIMEKMVHPDDRKLFQHDIQEAIVNNSSFSFDYRIVLPDGEIRYLLGQGEVTLSENNKATRMVGTVLDISKRKLAEQALYRSHRALRDSENKFRLLYDENPAMFFTIDDKGIVLSVNKYGAEALGYEVEELSGTSIFDLFKQDYIDIAKSKYQSCLDNPKQVQHWDQQKVCKDGTIIWVRESARLVSNIDGEINIFIVCEDITESHKLSAQLAYRATHDSLTGLFNRDEFEQRLQRLLNSSLTDNSEHALYYLDLEQFQDINDQCGHVAGDELLRQLGSILQEQIRKRDTIARLGGDEFGVLIEHCPLSRARSVGVKLMQAISDFQFSWEGQSYRIGVSAGLVPINKTSGNLTDILKNADTACYLAKEKGRNRIQIYGVDKSEYNKKYDEAAWVSRIQEALDTDKFQLYFQPIISIKKIENDIKRYEVLIRMQSDEDRIISPDIFLPVAERYNLSTRIDCWVIKSLFGLLVEQTEQGKSMPQYSINLSGHSLGDRKFLDFIVTQFEKTLIPPDKICFEITETVAIANLSYARRLIKVLKEKGCLFALDDFGSGLSSFSYLKNLQVDYLKIDGLFIRDISQDPVNLAIVRSMHDIGKALGKMTIAEYVEDEAAMKLLAEIGVDYAQGSYVGEEQTFERMILQNSATIIKFSKK